MNYRNTRQKEIILKTVRSLYHPTITDVAELVRHEHPSIGVSTVYRNVNLLVEQGQLRRLPMPDQAMHYDANLHPHQHFQCVDCGKILDLDFDPYDQLAEYMKEKAQLEIIAHETVFSGRCPQCGHGAHS
ncbi:MAG: transcriptional repressor [Bacilli bacterium]